MPCVELTVPFHTALGSIVRAFSPLALPLRNPGAAPQAGMDAGRWPSHLPPRSWMSAFRARGSHQRANGPFHTSLGQRPSSRANRNKRAESPIYQAERRRLDRKTSHPYEKNAGEDICSQPPMKPSAPFMFASRVCGLCANNQSVPAFPLRRPCFPFASSRDGSAFRRRPPPRRSE